MPLGHLIIAKTRHGPVRFLASLNGKAKIDAAPDNSGVRIRFSASVHQSADQKTEVTLQWTLAIEDCQPVMQLKADDMLYVYASACKDLTTWSVVAHEECSKYRGEAELAFASRARSIADLFSGKLADTEATPMKRNADLMETISRCNNIGEYE